MKKFRRKCGENINIRIKLFKQKVQIEYVKYSIYDYIVSKKVYIPLLQLSVGKKSKIHNVRCFLSHFITNRMF